MEWDPEAYGREGAFVPRLGGVALAWLAARPGERILDLGCGDGQLTRQIAAAGAAVTGVDRSAAMVAAARGRGVTAAQGAAEALPFAADAFDAVFSNAALHWVRDQEAMLASVRRVLRPGGRFVAEMGGHGNLAAIRTALAAVLERHGRGGDADDGNHYPTPEEYARRLERHAFTVDRIELVPRPTRLEAGGMAGWLRTFRRTTLEALPEPVRDAVVADTVALLAPALRDSAGGWTADYIRLRFAARR